tara:strand:- start:7335 stop:8429 length:1095 start_codon:yes stop_codon:yes gene_type:complete
VSHLRDTADTLYAILDRRAVSDERLARAAAWFEHLDTPIDQRSFISYVKSLQRSLPQESPLAALVPRWRKAWRGGAGFSEKQARAFLQDYTASLDPNLLFQEPITSGYAQWDSQRLQTGFAYASENQQSWSLLYCDRGAVRLRAGGRDLKILPGQVLLIGPGALYTLAPLDDCDHWGYSWAVFHPDPRWREGLHWPRIATQISQLTPAPAVARQLEHLFGELADCLQSDSHVRAELAHNLMEQILLRCRAELPEAFQAVRDARVERARAYIETHFCEAFGLDAVAEAANLSASRLASLFRAQCGLSVLAYRDELRMAQAARMLRAGQQGIAAVGAAVGYADPAYFSRTFTRYLGVSPREYRARR